MTVLLNRDTRVLVQGITGRIGSFHAEDAIKHGTNVVAGVTPGKGGTTHLGLPVFDTVKQAVDATGADASLMFVPPAFAADSIMEAADAGLKFSISIADGIPTQDMVAVKSFLRRYPRRQAHALSRAELRRHHFAGRRHDGHHARAYLSAGPHRHRRPLRYALLRSRLADEAARPRRLDIRRHRRRSGQRLPRSRISSSYSRPIRKPMPSSLSAKSADRRRKRRPNTSSRQCRNRSSPTSPGSALRRDGAWDMPAPSRPLAKPHRKRPRRSRPPAPQSRRRRRILATRSPNY